jgi:hypothetical protein
MIQQEYLLAALLLTRSHPTCTLGEMASTPPSKEYPYEYNPEGLEGRTWWRTRELHPYRTACKAGIILLYQFPTLDGAPGWI